MAKVGKWVTIEGRHIYINARGSHFEGKDAIDQYHREQGGTQTPSDAKKSSVKWTQTKTDSQASNSKDVKSLDEGPQATATSADYHTKLKASTGSMSKTEAKAVHGFTASAYDSIRKADKAGRDAENKDFYGAYEKLPQYKGQIYRGLKNLTPKEFAQFAEGKEITLDAVSSFSRSERVAADFANHGYRTVVLRVNSKSSRQVEHLSMFPDEQEVLSGKGTTYKVTNTYQAKYKSHANPVLIVEADEV